jgi:hypothetical protein
MARLYLLKRLLSAYRSSDHTTLLFNCPNNDGRTFTIDGSRLSLATLSQKQVQLMDEIETRMDQLLWGKFHLSSDIQDDPRIRDPGFGFATHKGNSWHREPSVLQYIIENHLPDFGQPDPDSDFGIVWNPSKCHAYMDSIFQLQRLFAVGIILTSGEPPRSTEYASWVHLEIPAGSARNVLWLLGTVILRATYNKSSAVSGQEVNAIRVPLPRLGRLLARFLVYLRPLFVEWQHVFRPLLCDNARSFLFAGFYRPVVAADLTLWLANWTLAELGVRLTIRLYRQFMSYVVKFNHRLFEMVDTRAAGIAAQLGHAERTDRVHYGGDAQMPSGYDRPSFIQTALVSAVTHIMLGHEPELLRSICNSETHMRDLERLILSIMHPQLTTTAHCSSSQMALAPSPDAFTDAFEHRILPKIQDSHRRDMIDAHSAFFTHIDSLSAPSIKSKQPPPSTVYVHPYMYQCLQTFMRGRRVTGFKNQEQAIVTQLMYQGEKNILYISGTSESSFSLITIPPDILHRFRKDVSCADRG